MHVLVLRVVVTVEVVVEVVTMAVVVVEADDYMVQEIKPEAKLSSGHGL